MTVGSATIADPTRLGDSARFGARLMVYIEGEEGPSSQIVTLPEGVDVTVGRSRGCTVSVNSERISRHHLRVTRSGAQVTVHDLQSRNGTKVNGDVIATATALSPGDEISAGPVTIVLTTTGAVQWRRRFCDARTFTERLRGEVDRATRYKRNFGLAVLQLEGDLEALDRALDQLSSRVRAMDTLGDFGDREVAVLLPELDSEAAQSALERMLTVVSADGIAVSAAVASFPASGSQPDELIGVARSAARTAPPSRTSSVVRAKRDSIVPAHVIAESQATKTMFALIDKVAKSAMTVLVIGETGAGKEIAARTVHERSRRRGGPFVVLNCACLPTNLLESQLFGHEKGAFTGADSQKIGFFEAANGGTLFLDELGEIEPELQAKLLRVLESHKVVRVGGTRELPIDVRVVCATNRDLEQEVAEGRFRADLFYRIAGFTIAVPPLRDRRSDIEPLAARFIHDAATASGNDPPVLSRAARAALLSYGWPGNIRELRNAVERATVLATSGTIEINDLPHVVGASQVAEPSSTDGPNILDSVERDAIARALDEAKGNQTHAARKLGLTRRALIYRMEKHGLKRKPGS